MKNRLNALLVAASLVLASAGVSHAMSELISISIEPEWPATSKPGTVIVYKVNAVTRAGQGLLEVSLSSLGLPEGATVSFSPSVLRFTGHAPLTQTSIMTVTCTNVTPTDTRPFTVTGVSQRDAVTMTNQVQPAVFSALPARPILALDLVADSGARLRGTGTSGQTYKIESTADLSNPAWTPAGASTADGNGRFTFEVADTKAAPMRFFRAVRPEPAEAP